MMTRIFILHLSLIENVGSATIQTIIQRSDVQTSDLYLFSPQQWRTVFGLSEKTAELVAAGLANKKILEIELQLIESNNIAWATILDDEYPAILRTIYCPPAVLYWQGKGNCDDGSKSLAIVGSRDSNAYGHKIVTMLVPEMVDAGWTIVSGGARGIDAIAHDAAVKAGGKTIVVLGSGLLQWYPASNRRLFQNIIDHGGLIVSSFPLEMQALSGHFPARNRIISGLSHGCLVVQAAQKSGALITAHYALEQGRDVFAVPGAIHDPLSAGCHKLIQNGAKLVASSADILSEFGQTVVMRDVQVTLQQAQKLMEKETDSAHPACPTEPRQSRECPVRGVSKGRPECPSKPCQVGCIEGCKGQDQSLTPNQKKIMHICAQKASLDDIMIFTELDAVIVQSELFDLQIAGKIEQGFTGLWQAL